MSSGSEKIKNKAVLSHIINAYLHFEYTFIKC